MTYTPINWQNGDTITAEKMNKMDNGWGVESSSQTYFTETVTTVDDGGTAWGEFAYSTQITAATATVTFDGTDYVCQKVDSEGSNVYGGWGEDGPDFTNYPFAIVSSFDMNEICTAVGGTHTVSVAGTSSSIETSASFEAAVGSVVDTSTMPIECVSGTTTYVQMQEAYADGRILFFKALEQQHATFFVTSFSSSFVTFIPENSNVTAAFDNGVFTVTVHT